MSRMIRRAAVILAIAAMPMSIAGVANAAPSNSTVAAGFTASNQASCRVGLVVGKYVFKLPGLSPAYHLLVRFGDEWGTRNIEVSKSVYDSKAPYASHFRNCG
jgi:hypothetical protein